MQEMANKVGCSKSTIHAIEKDKHDSSFRLMIDVCRAYQVSILQLVEMLA
jgi:DNA-binding XRE family transcriptional regulator